jgi:antitoxin component YwqK of YwqJK toxin-antitoxin module
MKKVILFFAIISMVACQQESTSVGEFDVTGYETSKVEGTSVTHLVKKDAEGKILEEGFIRNGKKDGQWITYNAAKGSVETVDSYIDGKLNGYSFIISSRGYIDQQAGYINNELNGRNFKYRYGRPKSEMFYKNGKLDGLQKEYYDNGKIQQETEFKNGAQDGVYNYYSDDGILRMSYQYKNGEKVEGGIIEVPEEENN